MIEDLTTLSGLEKVKKFLNSTNIHYTATEIYEFFDEYKIESTKEKPFTKSTIRTYLKTLADTGQIQVQDIPDKRDNYYLANKNPQIKYVDIELVGLWLQHYNDSNLLPGIKERLKDPDLRVSTLSDEEELNKFPDTENIRKSEDILKISKTLQQTAFFQGLAMINYNDIPKIAGINSFKRYKDGTPPSGVQRPREKIWIMELKRGLSSKLSAMLTSSILYFNLDDIEEIDPPKKRDDGLLIWKIRVPYNEHVYDHEKVGAILDGQQRMWAIDFLNLERTFIKRKAPIPIYGPLTVLLGDFSENQEYELELLRMYFINSNNTKNLPPTLKQELAGMLHREAIFDALPSKEKHKGYINKIVDILDENIISPFFHEIDHDVKSFNKLGKVDEIEDINKNKINIRFFSRKGIYDLVDTIIKGNPFYYNKDIEILKNNMDRWIDIIIDYFNAIKCVFNQEWMDTESFLRRNIGINSIGMLISLIWSHNLNSIDQDSRVKEIIKFLAKWKDYDENLDFFPNSKLNTSFKKDLKEYIKKIYSKLHDSWTDSTRETQISDEMEEIIAESEAVWEEIKYIAEKRKDKKYE